ncbi:MAG: tetratricopeptide repeat protein, partial [Halobacteriota archaeon]|nr:tetratricopeptide repeat protein [Halobacteriota archaeon]
IRIDPDSAEAHGNLGVLLHNLKRYEEAKEEYEIAKSLFAKQGRDEDVKVVEEFLKDLESL